MNKRYEYPIIELCNPDKTVIGILSGITELVISPKWGSCSEVSFTVYQKMNNTENPYYDKIAKSRLLHIDGFGYFTIQGYDEQRENKIPTKAIKAYSVEYLLNTKGVNLTFITTAGSINDTDSTTIVTSNYFFYKETQPEKSLLHQLIKVAPQWKIGYVSGSLKNKSRSFSETDKGLYGFLTSEVSQSYEALFVFDNENYIINAYDTTEVIKKTNIMLTFNNLLKSATVSELSDDIYTVINVSGAENLSIAKINPNGSKKLFCLDYYTGVLDDKATNYYENYNDWIKDNALKRKVLLWEQATKEAIYDTSENSYGAWTALQKKFNLLLLNQQSALVDMQSYMETANQNMSLYTDYSDVNNLKVFAKKKNDYKYITWGEAKSGGWEIQDYYEVDIYTTDSRRSVTRYAYWKNYARACEANLEILKTGGKLYNIKKQDFEADTILNADYNVASFSSVPANGSTILSAIVNNRLNDGTYCIHALETEVSYIQQQRDAIVKQYSYETYFNDQEKLALDPFIIEGSFSDDSFIVTDSMQTNDYSSSETRVQVIDSEGNISIKSIAELTTADTIMDDIYVAGQLVDAGYEKLKVVSQPSFSFELESANFLFMEKFKPFIDQLTQLESTKGSLFGSIINVELDDGNWVYPYLQEIEIDYDNPDSFTMRFGNRFRMSDDVYTFDELHNETTSAVSSVGSLLSAVSQPVVNGTIDSVTQYMKTALNLANQSITATDDNEFTFGKYGIKGRRKSSEQGNINGYDPEQLWMSNNKICFTTDGWETTKAVFGKITVDGVDSYGLIADTLVGKVVMGNNLIISNSSNTFTVNENGMTVSNSDTLINIDPTGNKAFDVSKKSASGYEDVFVIDNNGNLTISGGKIIVGDGSYGYIIDGTAGTMQSIATDSTGHPLFTLTRDGHLDAAGLSVNGDAVITPGTAYIPPTSTTGVVGGQGWEPQGRTLLQKLADFFNNFFNPYKTILGWVGAKDGDGWRGIWQYYSPRTEGSAIYTHLYNAGYHLVNEDYVTSVVNNALSNNNTAIDKIYITKNTRELVYYKKWSDTETYLQQNYQPLTGMTTYYTKEEVDSNFALKSAFDNYPTEGNLQEKLKDYAKTTDVNKTLESYAKTSDVDTKLSGYVTDDEMATALEPYAKATEITQKLQDYSKTSEIETMLGEYAKTDDVNTALNGYISAAEFETKEVTIDGTQYTILVKST